MLCLRHSSTAPLLTLTLSGPSFVDAILTKSGSLLYAIETSGPRTSIYRDDPNYGLYEVAAVNWPMDDKWDTSVELSGMRPESADRFLSRGSSSSRQFYLTGHPDPLKWKRSRHGWKCTHGAASTFVASFSHSKLEVYVNSLSQPSKGGFSPFQSSGAISASLLDHLVLTALLLTTQPDEWVSASPASSPSSSPSITPSTFSSPSSPMSITSMLDDCTCSECTFVPRSPPSTFTNFPSYHSIPRRQRSPPPPYH